MQASTVWRGNACSCIDRRRLSCASALPCIPSVAGTLPPATRRTLAPPFLSLSPSSPSRALFPSRFPLQPLTSLSPLSLSRPSLPGPRATTESTASRGMLRDAPVNVTLKTERACTYTVNLRCAMRGRAPAVSYVRER